VRLTIVELGDAGVVLRAGRGAAELVVPYEEILTAERVRSRGLDLHTRGRADPVRVRCQRGRRVEIESGLRFVGVRIVDCWGAIIAPTLLDFEEELDRGPGPVRQSSDDA
jgi:hypothetical protein